MSSNDSVNNSGTGGFGYIVLLFVIVLFIGFLDCKGNLDLKSNNNEAENANITYLSNNQNLDKRRSVTDDEFYWLTMLVACEGGHETREGQIAIVATVLNRLDVAYNGATCIADVIFDPYQYSCVWDWNFHIGDRTMYYSNLSEIGLDVEAIEDAVRAALNGEDPTRESLEGGAYYYYNPDCISDEETEARKTITKKIRIGNHVFYRVWD